MEKFEQFLTIPSIRRVDRFGQRQSVANFLVEPTLKVKKRGESRILNKEEDFFERLITRSRNPRIIEEIFHDRATFKGNTFFFKFLEKFLEEKECFDRILILRLIPGRSKTYHSRSSESIGETSHFLESRPSESFFFLAFVPRSIQIYYIYLIIILLLLY